ncbi:hypothetical protein A3732_15995 [Oleiphilus sp. HI0050]|nr:hypothetical protein A3732_15995 [Oleiphilus sp. HI0050]
MTTSDKKRLLIIGAGGHGQAIMDVAEMTGLYHEICFADDNASTDKTVMGREVLGKVEDVLLGETEFEHVFVAIGNKQKGSVTTNNHSYYLPYT